MLRRLLKIDFVYLSALAIFGTIFYGLAANTVLPSFGVLEPLSFPWIWPSYLLYVLPLYKLLDQVRAWIWGRRGTWLLKILIIINPALAVMGANYVNNGGGAAIAIGSVGLIALLFIRVLSLPSTDAEQVHRTYKAYVYSAALSLVYAFALRSNYLSGYDIHQEFQVFRLTSAHNFWSMDTWRDAYNACLSITILPTIIRNLTGIPELLVFRVLYPLILALIPVAVYTIGTRFLTPRLAFAVAFLFLLQAQYFSQLPALLRQGVAFLFFALLVDSLIRCDVAKKYTQLSVLVFGTGIVLSHYSTTYTTLAVLFITKMVITIGEVFVLKMRKTTILSIWILGYLTGITLLWNVLLTDTAGGLATTFGKVIHNIGTIFSFENKSDAVKGILYGGTDNNYAVNRYADTVISESPNATKYLDYKIAPIAIPNGNSVTLRNPIAFYFHLVIPWTFRLMIASGFVVLVAHYLRYYQTFTAVTLSTGMVVIVALIIVLPSLSVNYNFERLFQQMLILLAPVSVMILWQLRQRFRRMPIYLFVVLFGISYLLQTTGLANRTFFSIRTWIFDNAGETYYRYYTTPYELASLNWLDMHAPDDSLLYADKYTRLRVLAYTQNAYSKISSEINPPVIHTDSYIIEGFAATQVGAVFSDARNIALRFSFPTAFVGDYKNLIYSNSATRIYR